MLLLVNNDSYFQLSMKHFETIPILIETLDGQKRIRNNNFKRNNTANCICERE